MSTLAPAVETPAVTDETPRMIIHRHPEKMTEFRSALSNLRGEPDGAIRHVHIHDGKGRIDDIDVRGPKDGRQLIITVTGGLPRLKVRSGNVLIRFDSAWGNSVEVFDGAVVRVEAMPNRKVSTQTRPGGQLTLVGAPGCHGYQHVEEGGKLTLEGSEGRFTTRDSFAH